MAIANLATIEQVFNSCYGLFSPAAILLPSGMRQDPQVTQKRVRKNHAERRDALVAATIRCLKRDGLDASSVRNISKEAGISVGLINHHFDNKNALIAAAYRVIADELFESAWHSGQQMGDSPEVQLEGFFRGSFDVQQSDPGALRVWIAFWRLGEHSEEVRAVHTESYAHYRAHLEQLIAALCRDHGIDRVDTRLAAIGLAALLDGLWLELCLDPGNFSVDEGVHICNAWVRGLIRGGGLPGLVAGG